MKKRVVLISFNVFLMLLLCVGNIILWVLTTTVTEPEIIITPPNPYTAYCITTRKNERGVPIAPSDYYDKECDCYVPNYAYGRLYYYDSKITTPEVADVRTVNLMGTTTQAEHYETKRMGYSSYLTDLYTTGETGDRIGYKHDTNILTYYKGYPNGYIVRVSDKDITSEEMLRELLDPHVASYTDISEFQFSYHLKKRGNTYSYDEFYELEDHSSSGVSIYVKYQQYKNGIPTNEVFSYTIGFSGILLEFELSGYGEFDESTELSIDNNLYDFVKEAEINSVFVKYRDISILSIWERLAYIDGQYIMIVEVSPPGDVSTIDIVDLAIPLTSAPENAPVTVIPEEKYEVPAVSLPIKITVTAISVIVLAVLIVVNISRKKSTSSEQNENENEVL